MVKCAERCIDVPAAGYVIKQPIYGLRRHYLPLVGRWATQALVLAFGYYVWINIEDARSEICRTDCQPTTRHYLQEGSNMPKGIEELRRLNGQLTDLLRDPHPGLDSWLVSLDRTLTALYSFVGTPTPLRTIRIEDVRRTDDQAEGR